MRWRNYSQTFLKNQNWVYLFVLIFCQVEDYQKWLKPSCRSLTFTSKKVFLKNKNRSGTSLRALFSAWFFGENISLVVFFYLTQFQCLVAFTSGDIGQYVYCISLWSGCDVTNFEINFIFLIKLFFLHDRKAKTKS